MTQVRAIMTDGFISCPREAVLANVARTLSDSRIHATFVLDGAGQPVGVISDFDLLASEWLSIDDSRLRAMRKVTAGELMSAPVETIGESADIRDAARRMADLKISRLLVCDDHNVAIGTVSIGDVVAAVDAHPSARGHVRDVMSYAIVTCPPDTPMRAAMRGMRERRSRSIIVTEEGRAVGVLTGRDIVKLYATSGLIDHGLQVRELMTHPVITVSPDLTVSEAAERMLDEEIHRLVVVDSDERLLGIISTSDVVAEIAEDQSAWRQPEAAS